MLNDLYRFDPRAIIKQYNVLTDPAPPYESTGPQPNLLANNRCQHDLVTKLSQCKLPAQDSRPKVGDAYKVAAVCRRCRTHISLDLEYGFDGRNLCPNAAYPLHHFVNKPSSTQLAYLFQCSSSECAADLRITYSAAVVTPRDQTLISDRAKLQKRSEAARNNDPERGGWKIATPVDGLWRLRRYIQDSLKPENAGKKIPVNNKRFLEAYGRECDDVFTNLGFKFAVRKEE